VIAEDNTLAGYQRVHGRPPAFEGSDGAAYSVGVFSDDDPDVDGRYGAALLFVRWSADQQPEGHLETPYLARAADPKDAEAEVGRLTLSEVQAKLNALIAERARAGERR
jgi:hypothetical protein